MIFCLKFSVPKFAVLGWSKQLMPVTVKFRLDFIWRFVVASYNVGPMFPCNKATKQWRIVKIEFLATVGSKCGSQAFRCPCSENVAHCQKEICATFLCKESSHICNCCKSMKNCRDSGFSLCGLAVGLPAFQLPMVRKMWLSAERILVGHVCFQEFIPVIPSWNSKHPVPTRSLRFLRATVRSTSLVLWLHRAHPFVAAAEKRPPMWLLQTKFLASLRWKRGCQRFSCPCLENVIHFPKEICSTCLSKESMPFWNLSLHSLPEAWVPESHSTFRQLCIMLWLHHAHPFVAAAEKACLMQRSSGFGHGVVVSKIFYNAVIVLSLVLWDCCKPMNNCRDWAFSNSALEVGLPAFQLPMFEKCDSLPKEICWHVCLRNPCLLILLWNLSLHSLPEAWVPESRSTFRQLCITLWLHHAHSFVAAAEKRPISFGQAEGLVTELWPPRFVTMQWLCSLLCYVTAAHQPTLVEIELLATVGWKWGYQPFSCRCPCTREICSICLFQESIPGIPFGNSKHPLPTRSLRFLRAAVCSTSSAFCLHHAHPFVAAAGKTSLTQGGRGFGHGVVVSKICYNTVIVLSVVLSDCCKPMNNFWDWAFSNSGLEVGLPAYQLPTFAKCHAVPNEICGTCLFQESIPGIPFWNSKHPLPTRSLNTSSALWLHHAHPFVASAEKKQSHAVKQRVWSRSCGFQDLLQCSDCALSCAMRLLQTNQHLSRLSF